MKINKKVDNENQKLLDRIAELENLLNTVANDNGSCIVKQLPNGEIELNGTIIDNTTEVEYYNSSKATFGELTMFRIGKETKQREMDKLISRHMDEIDDFNNKINKLEEEIYTLKGQSASDAETIRQYQDMEETLNMKIDSLYRDQNDIISNHEDEKKLLIERYEGLIKGLEEDNQAWKKRYLQLNNISLNGDIITKYGIVKDSKHINSNI